MPELLKALIGLCALGAPLLIAFTLLALSERRDGRTRFVIVGGRTRRRSAVELNETG